MSHTACLDSLNRDWWIFQIDKKLKFRELWFGESRVAPLNWWFSGVINSIAIRRKRENWKQKLWTQSHVRRKLNGESESWCKLSDSFTENFFASSSLGRNERVVKKINKRKHEHCDKNEKLNQAECDKRVVLGMESSPTSAALLCISVSTLHRFWSVENLFAYWAINVHRLLPINWWNAVDYRLISHLLLLAFISRHRLSSYRLLLYK